MELIVICILSIALLITLAIIWNKSVDEDNNRKSYSSVCTDLDMYIKLWNGAKLDYTKSLERNVKLEDKLNDIENILNTEDET